MVTIEPIARNHLAAVQTLASDSRIGSTSNVPHPYPEDGAVHWFEVISKRITAGESEVFAILLDRATCGVISLNRINHDARNAEVDFWVGAPFQNRGIASTAAGLAVTRAWSSGLRTLTSSCLASNVASARVLARAGFAETNRVIIGSGKFQGKELAIHSHARA